jgi:hypothetical protein
MDQFSLKQGTNPMKKTNPVCMLITPESAQEMLSRGGINRSRSPKRVTEMAADMRSRQWRLTHQGIALNGDGSVKDGQHRLAAVVESGVAQWFWVFSGITDDDMEVIDTHRPRTIADAMTISGEKTSKSVVAVARSMYWNVRYQRSGVPSRLDMMNYVNCHRDAIDFSIRLSIGARGGHGLNASILSCVSRGWYTQDRTRLAEFLGCLKYRVVSRKEDQAAMALLSAADRLTGRSLRGSSSRTSLYRRTCSSLVAFLKYQNLVLAREITKEPFEIPGEHSG